jgi:cytosine/creatinine deaminase
MLTLPNSDNYWLKNARVPVSVVEGIDLAAETKEGLCGIDLHVREGAIAQIVPSSDLERNSVTIDLKKK